MIRERMRRTSFYYTFTTASMLLLVFTVAHLTLAATQDTDVDARAAVFDHKDWALDSWQEVIGSEFGFEFVQEYDLDGLTTFGCKGSVFRPSTHCLVYETVELAIEQCSASAACGGLVIGGTNTSGSWDDWVDNLEGLHYTMLLSCKPRGLPISNLFPGSNFTLFYNLNCTDLLQRRGYLDEDIDTAVQTDEEEEEEEDNSDWKPISKPPKDTASRQVPAQEPEEESSSLSTGAIIGIAVGGAVGLVLLLLLLFLLAATLYRRKGASSSQDGIIGARGLTPEDSSTMDALPEMLVAKTIDAELRSQAPPVAHEVYSIMLDTSIIPLAAVKALKIDVKIDDDENEGTLKVPPRKFSKAHTNSMDTAYSSTSGSDKTAKISREELSSPSSSLSRSSGGTQPSNEPSNEDASWWPPAGSAMILDNIWAVAPPPPWLLRAEELQYYHAGNGDKWRLGQDPDSEVYRARLNEREVAVKTFPLHIESLDSVHALVDGITHIVDCTHESLVEVYGGGVKGMQLMMACEYMSIGDLLHVLDSPAGASMTWNQRGKFIALDIIRGLRYIHARGESHGDLTSHSILMASNGSAKISGFGLKTLRDLQVIPPSMPVGDVQRLAWHAPEVRKDGGASDKADMFSFGVILWQIVTGEKPCAEGLRPLRVSEECSAEVADLVSSCTQSTPELRPDAAVVEAMLISIVSQED